MRYHPHYLSIFIAISRLHRNKAPRARAQSKLVIASYKLGKKKIWHCPNSFSQARILMYSIFPCIISSIPYSHTINLTFFFHQPRDKPWRRLLSAIFIYIKKYASSLVCVYICIHTHEAIYCCSRRRKRVSRASEHQQCYEAEKRQYGMGAQLRVIVYREPRVYNSVAIYRGERMPLERMKSCE